MAVDLISKKIRQYMLDKEETISVAESVTSGGLQLKFSAIPDAEKFFQGGITAYNIGQKYRHLAVEPIHAQAKNCVSQQVANQMALEVCNLFQSNWGIGITGYATPVEESGNKTFCFFAVVHNKKILSSGKIEGLDKNPKQVQEYYCNYVFKDLSEILRGL